MKKIWKRKYFFFTQSESTAQIAKHFINLDFVWDPRKGAGWSAIVEWDKTQLINFKVKLWNCKYEILKIHNR